MNSSSEIQFEERQERGPGAAWRRARSSDVSDWLLTSQVQFSRALCHHSKDGHMNDAQRVHQTSFGYARVPQRVSGPLMSTLS